MRICLFSLTLTLLSVSIQAQQWQYAGDTSACDVAGENPMIALNRLGELAIVYRDVGNPPEQTSVKRLLHDQWVHDGGFVFSGWTLGGYHEPCLAYDTAGIPYVAICNDHLTVKRFDGVQWVLVGDTQFTPGLATSISFKISPDNTPFIAFRDFAYNANISVMKFNGTQWVYVGQPGFSPNSQHAYDGAWCPSLAFDKVGTPYIAYVDITNNYRLSVMKFNGTSWTYVGNPSVSGGGIPTLLFDSQDTPIVCYTDGDLHVKKFNGSAWVAVGPATIAYNADYPFMAIDAADHLYAVYTTNNKANVMEYNGANWVSCGQPDFHPNAYYTTLAVSEDGANLYVGLTDGRIKYYPAGGVYNIVSVMKLERNNAAVKSTQHASPDFNVYPNPASSVVQVHFSPLDETSAVLRVLGYTGEVIYEQEFGGAFDEKIDLSKYAKGMYFVEIRTSRFTQQKKVVLN